MSCNDPENEEITQGEDAANIIQAKDTSVASVEELQSFVGGADIKVFCILSETSFLLTPLQYCHVKAYDK